MRILLLLEQPPLRGGVRADRSHLRQLRAQAVDLTTTQPQPALTAPLTRKQRVALIPLPKSIVAHLGQFVIKQEVAKSRIAMGVSNYFKPVVDSLEPDDPIVTHLDLHNVRIEKSNIQLIGPSGPGKIHLVKSLYSFAPGRSSGWKRSLDSDVDEMGLGNCPKNCQVGGLLRHVSLRLTPPQGPTSHVLIFN
jgi:hypothetical protein